MRKIIATAGFGYATAEHKEEFEFDDSATDDEITEEVCDWANQFVESWWEEVSNE